MINDNINSLLVVALLVTLGTVPVADAQLLFESTASASVNLFWRAVIDQPNGKSHFTFENDNLVLYYDDLKSSNGIWVTRCSIFDDGRTLSAKEQNGVTSPGRRISNPGK